MYTLIHKPTRVTTTSATLLDNIYTNIQITMDNCQSGILTSNISDILIIFDSINVNQIQNYLRKRHFTETKYSYVHKKNPKKNRTLLPRFKIHLVSKHI